VLPIKTTFSIASHPRSILFSLVVLKSATDCGTLHLTILVLPKGFSLSVPRRLLQKYLNRKRSFYIKKRMKSRYRELVTDRTLKLTKS
jgi:hypothetical protein